MKCKFIHMSRLAALAAARRGRSTASISLVPLGAPRVTGSLNLKPAAGRVYTIVYNIWNVSLKDSAPTFGCASRSSYSYYTAHHGQTLSVYELYEL